MLQWSKSTASDAPATRKRRTPKRLTRAPKPDLTVEQILAWSKEFFQVKGCWPNRHDGPVGGQIDLTWNAIDLALQRGGRGLKPGGSSLAKLFLEHFGRPHRNLLPTFDIEEILAWADAYHARHGAWPKRNSDAIEPSSSETWSHVDAALIFGLRGLEKYGSLAQLLANRRGVRNRKAPGKFTARKVLAWADAHYRRTGGRPTETSGTIEEAPGETWNAVTSALQHGGRGFPGGDSLFRFLQRHGRDFPDGRNSQRIVQIKDILAWVKDFQRRNGRWPKRDDGSVGGPTDLTWSAIDRALVGGLYGLPPGSSLRILLHQCFGIHHKAFLPDFSTAQILA